MKKQMFIIFIFILILGGCKEPSIPLSENSEVNYKAQMEQLEMTNEQMKMKISNMEKKNEEEKEALRTTLNLAFQLLTAITNKDYEYITSISSSNIRVNMEESTIYSTDYSYRMNDKHYLLENLEYRFYQMEDDKLTIGFANYFPEGHSTINIGFIKQDGQWLFDYLVTDA
ncbi:hypothetical protein [Psychrobacillus lasiicapitis]|uniref:Uncharacterized protein n=1 Tax=Psychrobacillus lasiicapitis TaxID=1636719 RepID=A0A544STK7_9BACI|nr:hypothetical protein [Psychrobacillus lasiicapitis]TQR08493.1 hypothetical protein FG382_21345 [Psychrobacillus lasiicapitis]GGA15462.1 hypothetical protein GCM10011384_00200 [Psychrobacillus lasiicapitis]